MADDPKVASPRGRAPQQEDEGDLVQRADQWLRQPTRNMLLEPDDLVLRLLARVRELEQARDRAQAVQFAMLEFAMAKPGGQQTRQKTAREMVEHFAYDLKAALEARDAAPPRTTDEEGETS